MHVEILYLYPRMIVEEVLVKKVSMEFINSFDVPSTLTINIELKYSEVTKETPLKDEFMVISIFSNAHRHTFIARIGSMCNASHIGYNLIVVGKLDEVYDELFENVVAKMKYASLVVATVKVATKEEVKRHLEQVCIHWNTKDEGCHWWMVDGEVEVA